jgi:hypothetical protein
MILAGDKSQQPNNIAKANGLALNSHWEDLDASARLQLTA